ncbi:hypothetical protein [Corynebacterium renale]|uniref:Uncharacterized protein n=1 Tax=Corynebacterium renale TaxID=1724 RepID=A0A2A9DMJ5_9CORY|nr:hypothetical protein [Corynebacterium renale]PFG27586.1 hypothetical protein ATK06_0656 [Corynebacterium renale]SQI23013.1 Uncharacterised protein [Corynebacterium renale]
MTAVKLTAQASALIAVAWAVAYAPSHFDQAYSWWHYLAGAYALAVGLATKAPWLMICAGLCMALPLLILVIGFAFFFGV